MTRILRSLMLVAGLMAAGSVRAQPPASPPNAERDSLEHRVRQRMGQMMKSQLGLTDEQLRKLQAANGRFEVRRRELFQQERMVRGEMRDAMRAGDTTQSAEISRLLDRMIAVQRQRVDLMEAEQRELATFLTPMQRARYFGMEEQIRRRVMEMRENGTGGMRRPGGGQGGPPRGDGGKRPPPGNRPPA